MVEAPRQIVSTTVVLSSLAVAATGATVAGGIFATAPGTTAAVDGTNPLGATDRVVGAPSTAQLAVQVAPVQRTPVLSRSADRRSGTDRLKAVTLAGDVEGPSDSGSQDLAEGDPRSIARALLAEFGFSADQFGCLDSLYTRESGWNVYADNPSSSAYGIPQALPGSKMASAGADWATNPVTQIRWGLGYIQDRYGSPCGAWAHSESVGWY